MKQWSNYKMDNMLTDYGLYDVYYPVHSFNGVALRDLHTFVEKNEPTMTNILRVARDIVGHSSKLSFLTPTYACDDVHYVVSLIVSEVLEEV